MSAVKTMNMQDAENMVDKFVILFRNGVKTPARIVRVDTENHRIYYDLITGDMQGQRCSGKYYDSQNVYVYDRDNLSLALLET